MSAATSGPPGFLPLIYMAAFALPLAAALVLTPLAGRVASRVGLMDVPGGHRAHQHATPLMGGLAVAGALLLVGVAAGGADGKLLTVLVCGLLLAGVGLVDDRRGVHPGVRILVEAGAGTALWLVGVRGGIGGPAWIDVSLTILWVVAVVNAFNMVDNHDGVASSLALASALGIAAIAVLAGDFLVGTFALAIVGSSLGFLRHNRPPATIFLGDAGSMLLGFLVAALVLAVDLPTGAIVPRAAVTLLLVAVPLADLTLVIVARTLGRRPVWVGGTDHTTHRFATHGWTSEQIVTRIFLAQMLCGAVAFVVARGSVLAAATALVALAAAGVAFLVVAVRMPHPERRAPVAVRRTARLQAAQTSAR